MWGHLGCLIFFLYVNIHYIAAFLYIGGFTWHRLSVFLKKNKQDRQKTVLGLNSLTLWLQSNHEANLPFLLCDLFIITFRFVRHAFIPELNQDKHICWEPVCNHQPSALYCASSCSFTQINASWRSRLLCTNTAHSSISSCCPCLAVKKWLVMQNDKSRSPQCFLLVHWP